MKRATRSALFLGAVTLAALPLGIGATGVGPSTAVAAIAMPQLGDGGWRHDGIVLARRGGDDRGGDDRGGGRGRGADDGPNHDAGDDRGRRNGGRGADDGANHDVGDDGGRRRGAGRRGRGTDDGPNHR